MKALRVAVVGVGRWGVNHLRVCKLLQKEGLCDGVVIHDRNRERLRHVARSYGIERAYTDSGAMFRNEEPEAAIISTQTVYHAQTALEALSYADVLVEKPIAATLEEARSVIRKAESEDRILAVGEIELFNPVIVELNSYLEKTGEDVLCITARRIGPGPKPENTENLGVAHDLLVHDITVSLHILDERPTEVMATTVRVDDFPYEVDIHAVFNFPGEVETRTNLHASWRSEATSKLRTLYLETPKRFIAADYITQTLRVERGVGEHEAEKGYLDLLRAYDAREVTERKLLTDVTSEPLLLEDRHFLQRVSERKPCIVDGWLGYNALNCVLRALESAQKGRRVKIPWEEGL
ncbi:MAG: Gfo/Idh/MocA family protein [Candidatus Bathyarchaeia archaeon]